MDTPSPTRSIAEVALTRPAVQALATEGPALLVGCDIEGVDLAGLGLAGWVFERCLLRRTSFKGARLDGSRWSGCRGLSPISAGAP